MDTAVLKMRDADLALSGVPIRTTEDEVHIRLDRSVTSVRDMTAGTEVDLFVASQNVLYGAPGRIRGTAGSVVWVEICGPRRQLVRREPRRPCNMQVALRVVRSEGTTGPWRPGTALNISPGGMLIECARPLVCDSLEIRFSVAQVDGAPKVDDRSSSYGQPILARARVAHWHQTRTGFAYGVSFIGLHAAARAALLSICEDDGDTADRIIERMSAASPAVPARGTFAEHRQAIGNRKADASHRPEPAR